MALIFHHFAKSDLRFSNDKVFHRILQRFLLAVGSKYFFSSSIFFSHSIWLLKFRFIVGKELIVDNQENPLFDYVMHKRSDCVISFIDFLKRICGDFSKETSYPRIKMVLKRHSTFWSNENFWIEIMWCEWKKGTRNTAKKWFYRQVDLIVSFMIAEQRVFEMNKNYLALNATVNLSIEEPGSSQNYFILLLLIYWVKGINWCMLQNSIHQRCHSSLFGIDQMLLQILEHFNKWYYYALTREQIRTTNRPLFDLIKN